MPESIGSIDGRGRVEIRNGSEKQIIWGQLCCESTEIGALGTFTTERKTIPWGEVVKIQVAVKGSQQGYNDSGTWKVFDCVSIAGIQKHAIQRV